MEYIPLCPSSKLHYKANGGRCVTLFSIIGRYESPLIKTNNPILSTVLHNIYETICTIPISLHHIPELPRQETVECPSHHPAGVVGLGQAAGEELYVVGVVVQRGEEAPLTQRDLRKSR